VRILLVNYELTPLGGGAANATMFIARALTHLGHQVSVLTTAFGDLAGPRVEDGVRVHRVRARRAAADRSNPREMASFVRASLRPARHIARECAIEAVIVFFSIPSGPVGWFLDWALGLPYVVSLRGGDVLGLVPELGRVCSLPARTLREGRARCDT
jgi:glycosyltransferase involved in cell wall biosynthesis